MVEILNDVNLKLLNEDGRSRIVHVNRVRPRYVRDLKNYSNQGIRIVNRSYFIIVYCHQSSEANKC